MKEITKKQELKRHIALHLLRGWMARFHGDMDGAIGNGGMAKQVWGILETHGSLDKAFARIDPNKVKKTEPSKWKSAKEVRDWYTNMLNDISFDSGMKIPEIEKHLDGIAKEFVPRVIRDDSREAWNKTEALLDKAVKLLEDGAMERLGE